MYVYLHLYIHTHISIHKHLCVIQNVTGFLVFVHLLLHFFVCACMCV